MNHHSFLYLPDHFRRKGPFLLAVFFLLGHLLGVWISGHAGGFLISSMRAVVSSRVSITGLLSALMLPLLFSGFAVYLGLPMLLLPIAFGKAFMFSHLGLSLCIAWGSAGWLMTPLVMWGSFCSMPVLYWYWLRQIRGGGFEWPAFCLALVLLAVIGLIDLFLIEPFLVRIITF